MKKFASKAVQGDADGRAEREKEAETNAAIAAAKAAEPYHAAVREELAASFFRGVLKGFSIV